jgi:micrococcal nuclease
VAHRWIFPARAWSAYDGDTITVTVDLGFRVSVEITGRLDGIDTPELRGPERADGLVARDWLRARLTDADRISIATRRGSARQTGKYGRWLITVWADGENLNEQLVAAGHAVARTY